MESGFFTSYARFDNSDKRIETFVASLTTRVAQLLGRADEVGVCFFDQNDVDLGEKWEEKIAQGINEARVLLCFTSPTFFNRPHCAKEFDVFRQRLRVASSEHPDKHIIPILWEARGVGALAIPSVLERYQAMHSSLPKNYRDAGLRNLKKLRPADYEKTLEALAGAIAERIRHEPRIPPLDPDHGSPS